MRCCSTRFLTFENTEFQVAQIHVDFLNFVLELFRKDMANSVAFIDDNCSTHRLVARMCRRPLLGRHIHRFNLALVEYLSTHSITIDKIAALMSKFRFPVVATKLRKHTHLKALGANRERCSSTYTMLPKYLVIYEPIGKVDIPEIKALMMTPTKNKSISDLCFHLSDLYSVIRALQHNDRTIHEVLVLFNASWKSTLA